MKNLKKSSFTLIELVLSIVIIGIVITALPALLNSTTKTQLTNLQEKTFFNAYTLVSLINTQEWDENNTVDDNYYKVLTANGGDSELKCIRKGVVELNNSSGATCATSNEKTSLIGVDDGEDKDDESTFDDVDDFNGFSTMINDINISVKVRYMNDDGNYNDKNIFFNENDIATSDTNLKLIEVNVSQNNKSIAVLKYTTSNIGMVKIKSVSE